MRANSFPDHHWHDRFLDAALEPARWIPVLQELADATGSARAELVGFGSELASFNWVTALDDGMMADFLRAGGGSPLVNFRILADRGRQPLGIVAEEDYDVARRRVASDAFIDFCEQYRMPFGCQTCLVRTDGALVGLSILRTRAEGRTSAAERRTFADAAAAALTAVRMQRTIERQGFHLLGGSLEAMSLPCLLLDGLGLARQLTPAAERLLAAHPLVTLSENRLSSSHAESRRRIDVAMGKLIGVERSAHQRVLLSREGPVPQLVIDFYRLPRREWTMHYAPAVIVVLSDRRAAIDADAEPIAQAFGLTAAEAQVALALAAGQSRDAIAAARGVSLETVRAQVKSLYQKTGCRRETELALLVNALLI